MMRAALAIVALILAALIVAALALHHFDPPQRLPLVNADYSRCVTIRTAPLVQPKRRETGRPPVSDLT